MMKRLYQTLFPFTLLSLCSSAALAVGSPLPARNEALGGTGVADTDLSVAAVVNPALVAGMQNETETRLTAPALSARYSDKNDLYHQLDTVSDAFHAYRSRLQHGQFSPADLPEIRRTAGELADQLAGIRGHVASAQGSAALIVTVPHSTVPLAFSVQTQADGFLHTDISQADLDYLNGLADGTIIPKPGDQNKLQSAGIARAALVTDYGLTAAHTFHINDQPISLGITPKLQQVRLYNYSINVPDYSQSSITDSRFRSGNTGFNVDAGLAAPLSKNWQFGLSARNLIARDIHSKVVNGYRDTYQIRPVVTTGLAWHATKVTTQLDVDLTPTRRFLSQPDSQYAGVGVEWQTSQRVQLRAGYRRDLKAHDPSLVSSGIGLTLSRHVSVQLTGMVGAHRTAGGALQMAIRL